MFQASGGSVAQVSWTLPGGSSSVVVPTQDLRPYPGSEAGGTGRVVIGSNTTTLELPSSVVGASLQTFSGSSGVNPYLYGLPTGSQTGLLATYYSNSYAFAGSATTTQVESTVNDTALPSGVSSTDFNVRWTGQVQAPATGTFTFTTVAIGGVRLYVNGQLIINNWVNQSTSTTQTGTISLVAGQWYDIRLDYFQSTGAYSAQLKWSGPGITGTQIVPTSSLRPDSAQEDTPLLPGLVGGADNYGLISNAYSQISSYLSSEPGDATAAVIRIPSASVPSGLTTSFPGYDLVLFVNLSGQTLADPTLGIGLGSNISSFASALLQGGSSSNPDFGGTGPTVISGLAAQSVWATWVPSGSAYYVNANVGGSASA